MKALVLITVGIASTILFAHASPSFESFPQELERHALRYFVDNTNPRTGLVRNRAHNFRVTPNRGDYRVASMAATGFGMAVLAHACQSKTFDCTKAKALITKGLTFTKNHAFHHKGWLFHFVDWKTGTRYGLSEVSTVDTAWFLAGAIYAAGVFPHSQIPMLVDNLYRRLDFWDMMTNGGQLPDKRTLSMGWLPEQGYLSNDWNTYAEQTLLVLLGLGHPQRPLPPDAWTAWERPKDNLPNGTVIMGAKLPLFVHQYSHLFVDFRSFYDRYGNYFHNSILATTHDRSFCAHSSSSLTYRAGFWGLSASDSPDGYDAFSSYYESGTVCPACAGASAMFLPQLVLRDLEDWAKGTYRSHIWGQYGFIDSINLDRDWFDKDVIGITVGALYLALANLSYSHSIWQTMSEYPPLERALAIASQAR